MREVELKGIVPDEAAARARVEAAGGELAFAGRLEDRRYDSTPRGLLVPRATSSYGFAPIGTRTDGCRARISTGRGRRTPMAGTKCAKKYRPRSPIPMPSPTSSSASGTRSISRITAYPRRSKMWATACRDHGDLGRYFFAHLVAAIGVRRPFPVEMGAPHTSVRIPVGAKAKDEVTRCETARGVVVAAVLEAPRERRARAARGLDARTGRGFVGDDALELDLTHPRRRDARRR